MKRRIVIEDKINNKTKILEVEVRDEKHLEAQIKYPSHITRDKTKYTRKEKHKTNYLDY